MDKKLATNGVEEMGRLISYMPRGFSVVIFLFIISAVMDFEYTIFTMRGSGEVLGQASVLVEGDYVKNKEAQVPIQLLDVVMAVLGLIIMNQKIFFDKMRLAVDQEIWRRLVGMIGLFFALAAASIFINAHEYTVPQLLLMGLHLLKLIEVVLIAFIVAVIVGQRNISGFSSPFLLGILISSVILILNKHGLIDIGSATGDRMETFGVIMLSIIMVQYIYKLEISEGAIGKFKQLLYAVTIGVGSLAILSCGKRGIEITYLAIFIVIFFYSQIKAKNRWYAILSFVVIILSWSSLMDSFNRSVDLSKNNLHGTVFRGDIINFYEGVKSSISTNDSFVTKTNDVTIQPSYRIPIISNLDYSGIERIGKIIRTIRLSLENIWIGSGFWGVQYKYSFLPDNGFQVLLETGLIGVSLLLSTLFLILRGTAKNHDISSRFATFYISLAAVALIMLCLFCNPLYMSRLVMVFMFYAFFCLYPRLVETRHHDNE